MKSRKKTNRDSYWVAVNHTNHRNAKHVDPDCPQLNRAGQVTLKDASVIRSWTLCKMCDGQTYGTEKRDEGYNKTCPLCGEEGIGMLPNHLPECPEG